MMGSVCLYVCRLCLYPQADGLSKLVVLQTHGNRDVAWEVRHLYKTPTTDCLLSCIDAIRR